MANFYEEFKVKGQDLVDKVKSILHEGNVRRIILKDEKGHTFLEIPLTIAAVGVVAAPLLAGIGAIAALVSNFTVVVERSPDEPEKKTEGPPA
jgi:repressor of nif and glnA expression